VTARNDDESREAVDAALASWRQGNGVVGAQWFVHRFTP
jgi:hypothetical protein